MKTLTESQLDTIEVILIETDCIWAPMRYGGSTAYAAWFERRAAYRNRGIDLTIGGAASQRKAGERELVELRDFGLIELLQSRGRRAGVKFTRKGDGWARTMFPSQRFDEVWPWLKRIDDASKDPDAPIQCGLVLEHFILGQMRITDQDEFLRLEDESTPLLERGLLEVASDAEGKLGYALTDEGREALAKGVPPTPPDDRLPARQAERVERFIDSWAMAINSRHLWAPSTPSQIGIPMSAGVWLTAREREKHRQHAAEQSARVAAHKTEKGPSA